MKTTYLSLLLIACVLLLCSSNAAAKNRKPKSKTTVEHSSKKPTIEKEDYCIIRGFYEEIIEGGTKFFICRLVSTANCVAIPCNVWGPYGPKNTKAVGSGPIPETLKLDPNKQYIVKFNVNGATEVQYVNGMSVEETADCIAIHYY